ncbi:MAG: hypothetical protein A2Z08_07410 [Deltaproteobacteria bacterium RBG_16_54_11]|nr:MAG: hypothetical protein A2Z08_07410 [Deltaproteobacteria bacterium RBG_16_54_11]
MIEILIVAALPRNDKKKKRGIKGDFTNFPLSAIGERASGERSVALTPPPFPQVVILSAAKDLGVVCPTPSPPNPVSLLRKEGLREILYSPQKTGVRCERGHRRLLNTLIIVPRS